MLSAVLPKLWPPRAATVLDFTDKPPALARWVLLFTILSVTVFSRFGLRVGNYPVEISFIAMYLLWFAMLARGWARCDPMALLLYAAAVGVGTLSLLVSLNFDIVEGSAASFGLLLAIYLPFAFVFRMPGDTRETWKWTVRAFGNVALFCAFAGIAQFFAQFVIHEPWLFKFNQGLPYRIQGPEGYNTIIPVGDLFKTNGFFLREPSHFSFLMALALLMELHTARRMWRMAAFGFALLLTYSGTGLLALAIGLMFPLGRRTLVTVSAAAICGVLAMVLLGDVLNLEFTINRVAEFGSERSSAYARYVAPVRRLAEEFHDPTWAAFLGHGPGTMQRNVRGMASFDPTWAKLLFEYGLLGFMAVVGLVAYCITRTPAPAAMRVVLFVGWLIQGGNLLVAEVCAMLYLLLCGWPAANAADAAKRAGRPP